MSLPAEAPHTPAPSNGRAMLEIDNLVKHFPAGRAIWPRKVAGWVKAVDGIDLSIATGETLGLVGESGCGKTTTTRLLLLLERPTSGAIRFDGRDVQSLHGRDLLFYRQSVQAVFQDPYSSLSPRMRVGDIIAEPLEAQAALSRQAIAQRVAESLEMVGLSPAQSRLFPHEFSGGQRQRIAIARAVATRARLIILDEPVSALDVSIRAQIMTLLEDLQAQLGLSYLFIGHDLATVTHISHRIAVMYLGKIVEVGESQELSANPKHPYTQALFAAALPYKPGESRDEEVVTGEVPSALNPPSGCRFHPRCPFAMPVCSEAVPPLDPLISGHLVACHLYDQPGRRSGMAIAHEALTVEEFLKLPETEPASELWRGRVVQKASPQGKHSRLQFKLPERIDDFAEPRQLAMTFIELRAVFGSLVYVPDVSVYRWDRVRYTEDDVVANEQGPPDIAIEIALPDQSIPDMIEKCLDYVPNGTEIALLIVPERSVVFRFGVGGTTQALRGADQIDLTSVLPGFELTVDQVFALLRRPGPRA